MRQSNDEKFIRKPSDSNTEQVPFIKWGNYKSKNSDKPDILECKVADLETFETEYSTNVRIFLKEKSKWKEWNLPLKSHNSNNAQLLNLWTKAVREGKLEVGQKFKIKAYLGLSKNNREIRKYALVT